MTRRRPPLLVVLTAAFAALAAVGAGIATAADPPGPVLVPAEVGLFPASATPAHTTNDDAQPVELGVRFTTDAPGEVTGVRFWKGAGNTGTHTGTLWGSFGSITSVTFTGETGSGWQVAYFPRRFALVVGTVYTVSYRAPVGHYAYDSPFFSAPLDAPPLHAPANAGVYRYGAAGSKPTDTFASSNYWVEPIFKPAPSAPATTTTVAPTTTTVPPSSTTEAPTTSTTTAPATTSTTTTAPPETTTLAPTTTTAPPSGTFPDASTTGVPAGTTLTTTGAMTVSTPGAVIDGMNITGGLTIAADGVTVRNSRITGGGCYVVQAQGHTGLTMVDDDVDGGGTNGGCAGVGNVSGTLTRLDITGVENGVIPSHDLVVEDSFIHDLHATGSPHYDGIQMDGGQHNVTIRHDTIAMADQTASVMIDNDFGASSDLTVIGNRLTGGTFTFYVDGSFGSALLSNVTVTGNRIGGWQYGPELDRGSLSNVVLAPNFDLAGNPL